MTTNCLMRPRDSYKDRIYSTNVVGWDGVKHVGRKENGDKDFSEIIKQSIELGGFQEDQPAKEILVGFGHHAALSYAPQLVEAVKSGQDVYKRQSLHRQLHVEYHIQHLMYVPWNVQFQVLH